MILSSTSLSQECPQVRLQFGWEISRSASAAYRSAPTPCASCSRSSSATEIDPEILLIDGILAIGDASFLQECFERLWSFRKAGKTILSVTRFMAQVSENCPRAIFIEQGSMMADGCLDGVIAALQKPLRPGGRRC